MEVLNTFVLVFAESLPLQPALGVARMIVHDSTEIACRPFQLLSFTAKGRFVISLTLKLPLEVKGVWGLGLIATNTRRLAVK